MSASVLPGKQVEHGQCQLDGTIEFQNIHFSYPTRPNVKVIPSTERTVPNTARLKVVELSVVHAVDKD